MYPYPQYRVRLGSLSTATTLLNKLRPPLFSSNVSSSRPRTSNRFLAKLQLQFKFPLSSNVKSGNPTTTDRFLAKFELPLLSSVGASRLLTYYIFLAKLNT